jgi:hypothetical protein
VNKLTLGLLCLGLDIGLIILALGAMRTDDGHVANPTGIAALGAGAVLGFVGLMLVFRALRGRR